MCKIQILKFKFRSEKNIFFQNPFAHLPYLRHVVGICKKSPNKWEGTPLLTLTLTLTLTLYTGHVFLKNFVKVTVQVLEVIFPIFLEVTVVYGPNKEGTLLLTTKLMLSGNDS